MKVATYLSASEVDPSAMAGTTAVVIDVIRATSTIIEALANGARAIYPTLSTEEAIQIANRLGREDTLLCGERKGLKVEGFDLGNSPGEFGASRVQGKRLVMTTTNGTRAFLSAVGASRVLAAAFLNLDSVVERVADEDSLVLVCAGKEGRFSLDDALCAGWIVRAVEERSHGDLALNDASRAVTALVESYAVTPTSLAEMEAGRALVQVGLGNDLALCAQRNRHDIVPEMHDRMIRAGAPPSS